MNTKLSEEDLNTIHYFWTYKGDLELFTGFEELIPLLEVERPEILLVKKLKSGEVEL